MSYSKLHSSLVSSSLWTEPDSVRILFITLLAMADRDGYVYGTKLGIARIANIEPEEIDAAWSTLLSPDKNSSDKMRNPESNGRRIEEASGGFRLLNYTYYRGLRDDDDRREQNRLAQERFRSKRRKPSSAGVSHGKPQSAHAEAEAEAEADAVNTPPTPPRGERARKKITYPQDFLDFWMSYPRSGQRAKPKALVYWSRLSSEDRDAIRKDLAAGRESRDDQWRRGFVPHATTYLNGRRWEDTWEADSVPIWCDACQKYNCGVTHE